MEAKTVDKIWGSVHQTLVGMEGFAENLLTGIIVPVPRDTRAKTANEIWTLALADLVIMVGGVETP